MATGSVEFKVKITDDGSFKKLEISADDFKGAIKHIKSETDNLSSGLNKLSKFAIGFNQIAELANKVGQSLKKIIDVGAANELQKPPTTCLPAYRSTARKRSTTRKGSSRRKRR